MISFLLFYFLEIDVVTVVEPMQNKDSTAQECDATMML